MALLYNPETKITVDPKYTNIKPGTPGWIEVEKMGDTTPIQKTTKTQPTPTVTPTVQPQVMKPPTPEIPVTKPQTIIVEPTLTPPPVKLPRVYEYITKTGEVKSVEAISAEEAFKKAKDISPTSGVVLKKEREFKPEEIVPKIPEIKPDIIEPPKSSAILSPEEGVDLKIQETTVSYKDLRSVYDKEITAKSKIEKNEKAYDSFVQFQNNKLLKEIEQNENLLKEYDTPEFKASIKSLQKEYLLPQFNSATERLNKLKELNYNETISNIKKYTEELATYKQRYADLDAQEFADISAIKGSGSKAFVSSRIAKIKEQYAIERANLNGRVAWLDATLGALREEKQDIRNLVNEYVTDAVRDYTIKINGLEKFISLNKGFLDEAKKNYKNDLNALINNLKEERNEKIKEESEKFQLMLKDPYSNITPDDSLEEAREKFWRSGNYRRKFDIEMKTAEANYLRTLNLLREEKNKFIYRGKDGLEYDLSIEKDIVRDGVVVKRGIESFIKTHSPIEFSIAMASLGRGAASVVDSLLRKYGNTIDPKDEYYFFQLTNRIDKLMNSIIRKNPGLSPDRFFTTKSDEEKMKIVNNIIMSLNNNIIKPKEEGGIVSDEEKIVWKKYKNNVIQGYILDNFFKPEEPLNMRKEMLETKDTRKELLKTEPNKTGKISEWLETGKKKMEDWLFKIGF